MMRKVFYFPLAARVAVLAFSLFILIGLIGWSVLDALSRTAAFPAHGSGAFAAAHVTAMRAEMEKIHRGRVDEATLTRIRAQLAAMPSAPHGDLINANYEAVDGGAIARYLSSSPLAQPVSTPEQSVSPPVHPVRIAQAEPSAIPSDRTYVGQKTCEGCHQQEASNWAHTIHAAVFTLNPRDDAEGRGCEACHGPGSAHVKKPSDLSTIISFSSKSKTPVPLQNAQCLSCHQ